MSEPHFGLTPRIRRGPLKVSNSDIGTFKSCRRKWYLGSFIGLRDRHEPVMGPLHLGTRVHSALERYYAYGHDLEEAYVEIAEYELKTLIDSGVVFDERAWRKETELGRIMLTGYIEWLAETGADMNLEVLGVEEKLSHDMEIAGEKVRLVGKMDLRVKDTHTGQNLIMDWKTTNNFTRLTDDILMNEQLLTYMLLERLNYKEGDHQFLQGAVFMMLRKVTRGPRSKPPYYERVEIHHRKRRLLSFHTRLVGTLTDYIRVVKHLDEGVDHKLVAYPTPGQHCNYCPFKHVCDMAEDNTDISDMVNDLYTQGDPHERYGAPETEEIAS